MKIRTIYHGDESAKAAGIDISKPQPGLFYVEGYKVDGLCVMGYWVLADERPTLADVVAVLTPPPVRRPWTEEELAAARAEALRVAAAWTAKGCPTAVLDSNGRNLA